VTSYRFSCQIPQCGNQPEPGSADDPILTMDALYRLS